MNLSDNLIEYLIKNSGNERAEFIELIRYNLGNTIYGHGDHFSKNKRWLVRCDNRLKDYVEFLLIKLFREVKSNDSKAVLSSAYSKWNAHIRSMGYDVSNPAWNLRRDVNILASLKLYVLTKQIIRDFNRKNFNYLVGIKFKIKIDKYIRLFREHCEDTNYIALFVPNDIGFFEKVAIKVFKELKKPSFFLAHGGMPLRYDGIMGDRTDYSLQWGKLQVDAFVKMGYKRSKLFAVGHPIYNEVPAALRNSHDDILVLTKSITKVSPVNEVALEDVGNAIMYLVSIQKVLMKTGVRSARLRPHPSESFSWYSRFIDNDFFIEDSEELSNSLGRSTLVIGPTSTTIIDSLVYGVNYVVYEPIVNNLTLMRLPVTPPLDGSDDRIPIAINELELKRLVENRICIDLSVLGSLILIPRNLSFLEDLIQ
ncbi:hypothetical protein N9B52_01210 [Schleiferiaceae bacterium]|nr:hypothetical protein [Schleiferiaceae bacterium]